MVAITRNNKHVYDFVKQNMCTIDQSTQTSEDDTINNHIYKKRKIDDFEDIDNESIHSDDTITDIESDDNYSEYSDEITDIDDEEDEVIDEKDISEDSETLSTSSEPNILDLLRSKMVGCKHKTVFDPADIEDTLNDEEERYYKSLSDPARDKLKSLYKEIVSTENSLVPIKFQILNADINNYIKNIALQKYEILKNMDDSSGEFNKLNNWITNICKIPFGVFRNMPVSNKSSKHDIRDFLLRTKNILNNNVYGHDSAKDQIIRIVAQWISNPNAKGNVIGIHGNPGVGKTTLIKNGVCKALNIPFAFIPLGGASDSSYLDGHSYTYEGSTNGKIIEVIKSAKCMNPVLYFDELDKVSDTQRGQEIINVLIHLTDPSQNSCFQDKYFSDIHFDLSKCLIIFTYNNNDAIDPILKDRMITIKTSDYNNQDKIMITKNHLIPDIIKEFDIPNITINDEIIAYLIEKTKKESGVRNLKRSIECIVSNINLELMLETSSHNTPLQEIIITKDIIDKYISESDHDMNPSLAHLYT